MQTQYALGILTASLLKIWLLPCAGGLQEVRRLEKLRAKRAFEATLPPIDDVERLPERQAMIEAWEVQEWVEREEEIKGVQEERLALLAQALQVGRLVGLCMTWHAGGLRVAGGLHGSAVAAGVGSAQIAVPSKHLGCQQCI